MRQMREEREKELREFFKATHFKGFSVEEIEESLQVILAIEYELDSEQ
jgi:hypothetical protein